MILIIGTLLVSACDALPSQTTPTVEAPEPVETIPIITATGAVVPSTWTTSSMSTTGNIDELLFEKGDSIEAGDLLASLKGKEDLLAAISGAEYEIDRGPTGHR